MPPREPSGQQNLDQWIRELREGQRATARAIADLALGLNAQARAEMERHDELQGLVLAVLVEARRLPERQRRDSGELTDRFKLPTGDAVEITRRTQRRAMTWALAGLLFILTHAAHYMVARYAADEAQRRSDLRSR